VRREWLKPFALGAATVSLATFGAWIYKTTTEQSKILVLSYVKAEGLGQPALPPDPASQYEEPYEYVVRIAQSCGVKNWTVQRLQHLDAPSEARLELPLEDVSNRVFNCLIKFVRPQRVTLEMKL
jgi:hypothetical protein